MDLSFEFKRKHIPDWENKYQHLFQEYYENIKRRKRFNSLLFFPTGWNLVLSFLSQMYACYIVSKSWFLKSDFVFEF